MKYHSLIALFALFVFTSVELKETNEFDVQTTAQKPEVERLEIPTPKVDSPPSVSERLAWKSKRGGVSR